MGVTPLYMALGLGSLALPHTGGGYSDEEKDTDYEYVPCPTQVGDYSAKTGSKEFNLVLCFA